MSGGQMALSYEAPVLATPTRHLEPPSRLGIDQFVEVLPVLVEAAGGLERLRRLVLELAVRGRLVPPDLQARAVTVQAAPLSGASRRAGLAQDIGTPVERPFEIPANWTWGRINDTGEYINGLAFKPSDWGPAGYPIIRIQNLTDASRAMNCARGPFEDAYIVRSGDLLVSWSATLDVFIWDREPAVLNQHIFRVLPNGDVVDRRFLYHALRYCIREMAQSEHAHGLVMKHINRGPFLAHPIPIPPLAEQKRIVAKVDELMRLLDDLEAKQTKKRETQARLRTAALDALTSADGPQEFGAAWERVAKNFETLFDDAATVPQLRDAILGMAFVGRLVGPAVGDGAIADVVHRLSAERSAPRRKEAIEAVAVEEVPASPSRWAWVRLGNIADVVGGVTKGRDLRGRSVKSYPYLRVANVQRGFLDLGHMKEIDIPEEELGRYRLLPGDILFTEGGDWDKLGRSAVWRGEIEPCIHQNHVFRARLLLPELDPAWFSLFANSPLGRRYFENAAKQTTNLASINMTQLRNCPVPLPPLAEQRRIVARIDKLMRLCDDLESGLRHSETTAARLAKALTSEMVG